LKRKQETVAYSDPQTITINAVAIPLNRINTGTQVGQFKAVDGQTRIEIDPKNGKRYSRAARLYQSKTTADPLVASTNVRVGDMISFSINYEDGWTEADILLQATGFITWLTASTNANLKKLISGEN
jgi:hypothetical protein